MFVDELTPLNRIRSLIFVRKHRTSACKERYGEKDECQSLLYSGDALFTQEAPFPCKMEQATVLIILFTLSEEIGIPKRFLGIPTVPPCLTARFRTQTQISRVRFHYLASVVTRKGAIRQGMTFFSPSALVISHLFN